MKLLTLLFCSFITASAFSQVPEGFNFQIEKKNGIKNFDTTTFKIEMMKRLMQQNQNTIIDHGSVGFETKLGKMYFLPQDGMPCIVPDMKDFQIMPNVGLYPEVKFNLLIETMPNLFKGIIIPKDLLIK